MTDEQLKARCAVTTTRIIDRIKDDCLIDYMEQQCRIDLESLCREMVAEGLERARNEASTRDFGDGDDFQDWCRQEAEKVKGGG